MRLSFPFVLRQPITATSKLLSCAYFYGAASALGRNRELADILEYLAAEHGDSGVNGYLVESGAVVERIFAELFHALGQDDCLERFALFKRALFEAFDSLADGELLERGAAVECAHRNALNRAGNRYLDRSGALEERVVVNLSDGPRG